ncbi:MAG: hypothetical protein ABIR80_16995, partial [Opitutaceae bacterium]
MEFAAGGGADVVADYAAEGDGGVATSGSSAVTEVDVFAAVDEGFVEAAELRPEGALDKKAGAGDGGGAT